MSYFYLKPMQGTVSLHVLQECVYQRWKYFQNSIDNESVNFCQYVCEDSAYDNVGHFMLSLLSSLSADENLINAVIKGEEELFMKRINSAKTNDIRLLSKSILKALKPVSFLKSNEKTYLDALSIICRNLLIKHLAEHITDKNHRDNNCEFYHIAVHFSLCLPLVAKRLVDIDSGIARIPCGLWKYFLRLLFRSHIISRYNAHPQNRAAIDPRWKEIILKLRQDVKFSNGSSNIKVLSYKEVDKQSDLFPLCMKHLHTTLRHKHRLSHNERFRYSLYLKDIGMPVQQAIHFWQHEYSKNINGNSSCTHTWPKDGNKYIYGIRHLYGLEGSHKNYCMTGCRAIQSRTSSEGGCPFKHFDTEILKNMIHSSIKNEMWEQIIAMKNSGKSSEACSLYKRFLISAICIKEDNQFIENNNEVLSPVKYYEEMNSAHLLRKF